MQEVMVGLQFFALVPILVVLVYKPALNHFFKLLFASVLLSFCFDMVGDVLAYLDKSNLGFFCLYYLCNAILIIFLWKKVPFYSQDNRTFINRIGIVIVALMVLTYIYYKNSIESFYLISCLSVFLGLILALQFYYKKISLSSDTALLNDPYFITATGFILFSLSTIIILAAQILYKEKEFINYTWILRQGFYMIYNFIIGYAFYVLYKTQVNK